MEYNEALAQISEIHAQLAKGEIYRGFRSLPVALSGLAGLAAAALAPQFVAPHGLAEALRYWIVVAVACGLIGCAETAINYWIHEDLFARRQSRKVLGQFVPGLAAGIGLTWGIAHSGDAWLPLLPGLWAIVFGLALFATRPYLPRASGYVALWYLCLGCLWVGLPSVDPYRFGWMVAVTFGIGQIAAAVVLFWNVERPDHG